MLTGTVTVKPKRNNPCLANWVWDRMQSPNLIRRAIKGRRRRGFIFAGFSASTFAIGFFLASDRHVFLLCHCLAAALGADQSQDLFGCCKEIQVNSTMYWWALWSQTMLTDYRLQYGYVRTEDQHQMQVLCTTNWCSKPNKKQQQKSIILFSTVNWQRRLSKTRSSIFQFVALSNFGLTAPSNFGLAALSNFWLVAPSNFWFVAPLKKSFVTPYNSWLVAPSKKIGLLHHQTFGLLHLKTVGWLHHQTCGFSLK